MVERESFKGRRDGDFVERARGLAVMSWAKVEGDRPCSWKPRKRHGTKDNTVEPWIDTMLPNLPESPSKSQDPRSASSAPWKDAQFVRKLAYSMPRGFSATCTHFPNAFEELGIDDMIFGRPGKLKAQDSLEASR